MSRGRLFLLLGVFALTRLVGGYIADHPQLYAAIGQDNPAGDVVIYQFWANALLQQDVVAYAGVGIEYPPGSLPVLALPEVLRGPLEYRTALVWLLVAIDAFGLVGLLTATRRWGSSLGPWLWTLLVPLLGPIAYTRIDLFPAVLTIWSMASAASGAWFASGAWLGFGVVTKVYPAFLLPAAFLAAAQRRQFVNGAVLLMLAPLVPFVASLPDVWRSVAGYHLERGIQIESLWASGLLLASRFGYPVQVVFNFGAFHVEAPTAGLLKLISSLLSLAALGAGTWLAWRAVPRGDAARLAAALFVTLTLITAVGSVFSPQFVLWLIGLGAVAACARDCPVRGPAIALAPVALLTQILFPFLYEGLAPAFTRPLVVLLVRNVLVLGIGLWGFVAMLRTAPPRAVAAPEQARPAEVAA
jgi:hypothetical protein